MEKTQRGIMIICAVLLCVVMTGIFLRVFTVHILVKRMHLNNGFTTAVLFDVPKLQKEAEQNVDDEHRKVNDWAKVYPFEETGGTEVDERMINRFIVKNIHTKVTAVENKIQAYTANLSAGYMIFVEWANRWNGLLGWNLTRIGGYNKVVEMEDGWLTSFSPRTYTVQKANAIISFSRYCEEKGIPLVYVAAPEKIGWHDAYSGIIDFSNQNTDEFLSFLDKNNVRFIDLRQNIEASGLVWHDLFFKTDNHWKPETGIWVSSIIAEFLNRNNIIPIKKSFLDLQKWRNEVYKDCFLGSQGRVVTLAKASPDDISLLYPKFETKIRYISPDFNWDKTGDFSIIYDMKAIEKKDFQGKASCNAYDVFPGGTYRIENIYAKNKGKVLMVTDSFGKCVAPFLALNIQQMDAIDLRGFTGSLKTYIKVNKPDVVIVLYCAGQLSGLTNNTNMLFSFQ